MLFPGGRLWKYGLKKGFNALSKVYAAVPTVYAVWRIARLRIILVALSPTEEVSEGSNINNLGRSHLYGMLAKNLAAFCPCPKNLSGQIKDNFLANSREHKFN